MVHGKKRIPYWIDWRLPGLAGPEYHAVISFGLPIEPEDSQYGEYRMEYPGRVLLGLTPSQCAVKQHLPRSPDLPALRDLPKLGGDLVSGR